MMKKDLGTITGREKLPALFRKKRSHKLLYAFLFILLILVVAGIVLLMFSGALDLKEIAHRIFGLD